MKKILMILAFALVFVLFVFREQKEKLLILNWGEYINDEVVELFEEEYNVDVIISIADSNELFYSKVKSGTTAFDLVLPSEYMIEKMKDKDLLQKIDLNKLENYDLVNNPMMPGVLGIQDLMFEGNEEYAVPYFWGTFGLMYNKRKVGLEEAIIDNEWKGYFNPNLLPADTRVGMYNTPRYAYAATMFYNDLSPNEESQNALDLAKDTLRLRDFNEWGTDTLKKGIVANNLDLAFVYTGDFLDSLYIKLETDPDISKIEFDIHIPEKTIAFMDGFVIPKTARHVDLAHKFIDFLLRPEIAYLNASVVGYCTPLVSAYNKIVEYNGDDEWLNAWAYATSKYYPLPEADDEVQFKGTPLANLHIDYLSKIQTLVNNIKAE